MKVVAVIPARYASTRFPGKPLTEINGKSMVNRIYEQVDSCRDVDITVIATDDKRIYDASRAWGGRVVMTGDECVSGTDRVARAMGNIDADIVVNVQGDQIVLDVEALSLLITELRQGCEMATIAVKATEDEIDDPNCVKVVRSVKGFALYFSRSPIPYVRYGGHYETLKHIGIYGFTTDTLRLFTTLDPSGLELTESLEQLRALENGIPIKVIVSKGGFFEINTPEDKERLLEKWRS